jgi:hypothetical protein
MGVSEMKKAKSVKKAKPKKKSTSKRKAIKKSKPVARKKAVAKKKSAVKARKPVVKKVKKAGRPPKAKVAAVKSTTPMTDFILEQIRIIDGRKK